MEMPERRLFHNKYYETYSEVNNAKDEKDAVVIFFRGVWRKKSKLNILINDNFHVFPFLDSVNQSKVRFLIKHCSLYYFLTYKNGI